MAKSSKHTTLSMTLELDQPEVLTLGQNPSERRYEVGDTVKGRVIVEIVYPQPVEIVTVALMCVAWHKKIVADDEDLNTIIATNTTHRRALVLTKREEVLMKQPPKSSTDSRDETFLRNGDMKAKTHTFHFSYVIEKGSAEAKLPGTYEDANVKIVHYVHAVLKRPDPVRPVNCIFPIIVRPASNVHDPELSKEVAIKKELDMNFSVFKGKLDATLTVPKSVWTRGDTIPLKLQVDHTAVAKSIKSVSVVLYRSFEYHGLDSKHLIKKEAIVGYEYPLRIEPGSTNVNVNVPFLLSNKPSIIAYQEPAVTSSPDKSKSAHSSKADLTAPTPPATEGPPPPSSSANLDPTYWGTSLYDSIFIPKVLDCHHFLQVAIKMGKDKDNAMGLLPLASTSDLTATTEHEDKSKDTNVARSMARKAYGVGVKILEFQVPLTTFSGRPGLLALEDAANEAASEDKEAKETKTAETAFANNRAVMNVESIPMAKSELDLAADPSTEAAKAEFFTPNGTAQVEVNEESTTARIQPPASNVLAELRAAVPMGGDSEYHLASSNVIVSPALASESASNLPPAVSDPVPA